MNILNIECLNGFSVSFLDNSVMEKLLKFLIGFNQHLILYVNL